MRGVVGVVLTVAVVACAALSAARGDDFPSKPITIMVGLAPGGITDVTARLYAEAVSRSIGQRITIENRPAAAGALAASAVQNAPPDGTMLLVFSGSQHATVACCEPEKTSSMVPSGGAFCTAAAASAPAAAGRFSIVMRWPILLDTASA